MKVLVLGAGIAGVTTAYELHRDGHEVTVIDREELPASFTSYANAGLFAPGHSYAWSSPAAPRILLRSLWRNDQALRLRPSLNRHFLSWMARFLGECTTERASRNTSRKARLCNYSLAVFHETLKNADVPYDGRQGGLLYLYRSEKALAGASLKSKILVDNGCEIETLDRNAMAARDPALLPVKDQFAGALFAKNDESGDGSQHRFTRNRRRQAFRRRYQQRTGDGGSLCAVPWSLQPTSDADHRSRFTYLPRQRVFSYFSGFRPQQRAGHRRRR
jgi:D-amino-acid dehydrogenase